VPARLAARGDRPSLTTLGAVRLLSLLVLTGAFVASAEDVQFGRPDPGLINLRGRLVFLPEGTPALPPDLDKLPTEAVIYGDRLDVSPRNFAKGFPGVSQRVEWFALVFEGTFTLDVAGIYGWRLHSDDGSKLWIDDALVIDHDGLHPPSSKAGALELQQGVHRLRVAYFQGPAKQVALQLFVTPPMQNERVFVVTDFARQLTTVFQRLGATPTPQGITVKLETSKLFLAGKSELSPAAREVLDDVASALKSAPGAVVNVSGLTQPGATENSKPALAEARATAITRALKTRDTGGARFEDKGWGGEARETAQVEVRFSP